MRMRESLQRAHVFHQDVHMQAAHITHNVKTCHLFLFGKGYRDIFYGLRAYLDVEKSRDAFIQMAGVYNDCKLFDQSIFHQLLYTIPCACTGNSDIPPDIRK